LLTVYNPNDNVEPGRELRRKLQEPPLSPLTVYWHQFEDGKFTTRYGGDDGLVYESVWGEGWFVVGKAAA
jgi:hypothetical protein